MSKYRLVLVTDVNRFLKKGWVPYESLPSIVDSATGSTYVWVCKAGGKG